MTIEIGEEFADALRGMLVERVQSSNSPCRRAWWPRTAGPRVALAAGAIAAGGGVAAATGVLPGTPGSTVTTQLSNAVTVVGIGTETIRLGTAPQGANAIGLAFTCLTPGHFTFADGSSESCSEADLQDQAEATTTLPLAVGQDRTAITAAPGERWQAKLFYASTTQLPYRTNADGQTYGTDGGTPSGPLDEPDLVAVQATNGKIGYAYTSQLNGPMPTSPAQAVAESRRPARTIPVYESDGKTQIGEFRVGN
jgi:hypothetical protein